MFDILLDPSVHMWAVWAMCRTAALTAVHSRRGLQDAAPHQRRRLGLIRHHRHTIGRPPPHPRETYQPRPHRNSLMTIAAVWSIRPLEVQPPQPLADRHHHDDAAELQQDEPPVPEHLEQVVRHRIHLGARPAAKYYASTKTITSSDDEGRTRRSDRGTSPASTTRRTAPSRQQLLH